MFFRLVSIVTLALGASSAVEARPAPPPAPEPGAKATPTREAAPAKGAPATTAEPVLTESCDGARTTPTGDARALECSQWRVVWREGGTPWGFVTASSYDAVIADRERQLGFARQYARFFEVPVDERYAEPSPPICSTCQPQAPVGRWGDGQKFSDSAARRAIAKAEGDIKALDAALEEHVPRLKDVARLARDSSTAKAAKAYAKQLRQGVLDQAKARLALDNAVVFRSEKNAKQVSDVATARVESLGGASTALLKAVGTAVSKAHGGRYYDGAASSPERAHLEVEVDGTAVKATYVIGAAQSTWFEGEVALDGGIAGRSLVAPEKGALRCQDHTVDCGYVYIDSVLRFSERKDPEQKMVQVAELWFRRAKWVMAKPFTR